MIDPVRCPIQPGFMGYELRKDKNGNFTGEYPDRDNHAIDAVRYALEAEMKHGRAKVKDIQQYPIWYSDKEEGTVDYWKQRAERGF